MLNQQKIQKGLEDLQDRICHGLEQLDGSGKTFAQDLWQHKEGFGGRTRIFQEGNVLEKGGVNFSAVSGNLPPLLQKELNIQEGTYFATGVSIVLHPKSPMVPIIHANVRYFETSHGEYWFGGGIDLTPHYINPTLAKAFHLGLKAVCDRFDMQYYPRFKAWADEYFYIQHRGESRGIGGIFFDRLGEKEKLSKEQLFDFIIAVGDAFVPLYAEQVQATKDLPYQAEHLDWQALRRGRYVEFNLAIDKGTKFGLETSGRIESILMSLPKNASWAYNHQPEASSAEAQTMQYLKQKSVDWLAHNGHSPQA
jgi:coproporphyrinogen III oxidase